MAARRKRLSATDLLREVSKGDLKPVYLLTGPETYLISEVVEAVRGQILGHETDDWNEDRLRADEVDGSTAVLRADTPPVGRPQRLVIVRGIEKWKDKDHTPVVRYLERPNPTTVLVLVGAKIDGRSKLAKTAAKAGTAAKLESLREREIPPLLVRMAKKQGKSLSAEAAQMLVMRCGEDLQTLSSEIQKLALYVGEAPEIAPEDVAEGASGAGTAKIFALCDAVGAGKADEALRLLGAELVAGDRSGPIRINAMLSRHFRLLMKAAEAGGNNLAAALGLPPFIASQYGRQARRFSAATLSRAHDILFETDRNLKGGSRLAPRMVIEQAVLSLCRL